MNNIVVYQHKTKDTNKIFYIGIGNIKRPYSKYKRNILWKNIVNKHDYKIEILHQNLTWEEACNIEINLIKEYGRRDNKTGILCNMTDGGDGKLGSKMSDKTKFKLLEINTGNKYNLGKTFSDDHKLKLSISHKNIFPTEETKIKMQESKSNIIINLETGIFYYGFREAADIHNMKEKTLWNKLSGISKNNTNLIIV